MFRNCVRGRIKRIHKLTSTEALIRSYQKIEYSQTGFITQTFQFLNICFHYYALSKKNVHVCTYMQVVSTIISGRRKNVDTELYLVIVPNMQEIQLNENNLQSYKKKAAVFKAIAHPTRLWIVEQLSSGERCVCVSLLTASKLIFLQYQSIFPC